MTSPQGEWPFDVTEISAPDGSITAKFVSFGSTLTELWVNDKSGKKRNVVLGYDDNTRLLTDPDHPVFNAIVGRYAGRMKHGRFSILISKDPKPGDPNVYQIPTNDHNGLVTLHGGITGWDRKRWTMVDKSPTSVTYKHVDEADEGFPGTVTALATHTVSNGGKLRTEIRATATEKTPILLTQHNYWNLDAFQDGVNDILEHELRLDASKVIELNEISTPTGKFIDVDSTPFDFRTPSKIGARWEKTIDLCGKDHQGYNAGWVLDNTETTSPAITLQSGRSGIRLDITTNQPAVVVYTSFWLNSARKEVHRGPTRRYGKHSAVAIEQQGHIDAVNTPEWGVDQIYHPEREYLWVSEYRFSTLPETGADQYVRKASN